MERPQIGCILMAAGASARFGSDKLAAELGGRSLLRRACEAVPAVRFRRVCIVTARRWSAFWTPGRASRGASPLSPTAACAGTRSSSQPPASPS